MKSFRFFIHGNEYKVDVKSIEGNLAQLEVNGTLYDVEIDRKLASTKTPTIVRSPVSGPEKPVIDKKEGGSPHAVKSPLPGIILHILVKPGDIVKQGQKVIVMEAMKMENQVLSEKDGVVERVMVQAGQTVLQGDTLIEMI